MLSPHEKQSNCVVVGVFLISVICVRMLKHFRKPLWAVSIIIRMPPINHRNHGIIVSIGGLEHLVRLLLPTLLSEIKIHQNWNVNRYADFEQNVTFNIAYSIGQCNWLSAVYLFYTYCRQLEKQTSIIFVFFGALHIWYYFRYWWP